MWPGTNEINGKGVLRNLGDVVANEHLGKYVKCVLTDIQVTKSYNCDGDEIW